MTHNDSALHETEITCTNCEACCCRLEAIMLTDTGIPGHFVEADGYGAIRMMRLEDGWCSALDRNTQLCRIYAKRPLVCREFTMGGVECIAERSAKL